MMMGFLPPVKTEGWNQKATGGPPSGFLYFFA